MAEDILGQKGRAKNNQELTVARPRAKPRLDAALQVAIDFSAMPDIMNRYLLGFCINSIDHPVIANSKAIQLLCTSQFD